MTTTGLTYIGVLHRRISEAREGIYEPGGENLSVGSLILRGANGDPVKRARKKKEKFIKRRGRGLAPKKRAGLFRRSSRPNETEKRSKKGINRDGPVGTLLLFAAIYGPFIAYNVWFDQGQDSSTPTADEEQQQHERVTQRNYELLVQDLGYTLPPIDPNSSQYDPGYVEQIRARQSSYIEQGYHAWESFVAAAEDYSTPPDPEPEPTPEQQPTRADEPTSLDASSDEPSSQDAPISETHTNQKDQITSSEPSEPKELDRAEKHSECELKKVMSDADYRACGIDPP